MSKPITALVPTSVAEAQSLAKVYAASNLLPQELRNKPADVFVTIMAGLELGIAPMAALRIIHVVQGKPVLSADGLVACAQSSGHCEYFRCVESDDAIATYETKRRGSEAVRRSFTIDDAKRAGLLGNPTWKKYPQAMLRARAKADLARDVYPDAVAGVYTPDEAENFAPSQPALDVTPEAGPAVIEADVVEGNVLTDLVIDIEHARTKQELHELIERCKEFSSTSSFEERCQVRDAYKNREKELSDAEG